MLEVRTKYKFQYALRDKKITKRRKYQPGFVLTVFILKDNDFGYTIIYWTRIYGFELVFFKLIINHPLKTCVDFSFFMQKQFKNKVHCFRCEIKSYVDFS